MLHSKVEAYTVTKQFDAGLKILDEASVFINANIEVTCARAPYHNSFATLLHQAGRYRQAAVQFLNLYRSAEYCDNGTFDKFYNSYSGLHSGAGLAALPWG